MIVGQEEVKVEPLARGFLLHASAQTLDACAGIQDEKLVACPNFDTRSAATVAPGRVFRTWKRAAHSPKADLQPVALSHVP